MRFRDAQKQGQRLALCRGDSSICLSKSSAIWCSTTGAVFATTAPQMVTCRANRHRRHWRCAARIYRWLSVLYQQFPIRVLGTHTTDHRRDRRPRRNVFTGGTQGKSLSHAIARFRRKGMGADLPRVGGAEINCKRGAQLLRNHFFLLPGPRQCHRSPRLAVHAKEKAAQDAWDDHCRQRARVGTGERPSPPGSQNRESSNPWTNILDERGGAGPAFGRHCTRWFAMATHAGIALR